MVQGIGAQVVPENAEGHRCCRRGMNCCYASAAHSRGLVARTGEGAWDVVFCFEAQVVPENAEGHRRCRRGMNCCCAVGTHARTDLARIGEGGSVSS